MTATEFEPYYREMLANAYQPPRLIDSWSRLAKLAWEFAD